MKICIVTAELAGPSTVSGVGTSCYHLAKSFVVTNHDVEILYCARECPDDLSFHVWQCAYQSEGIHLTSIRSRGILLDNQPSQQMSNLIYETLKGRDFDLIVFSGVRGLGFFCVSAKKSGIYFQGTQLWTMFDRPTEWDFEQNDAFISKAMDLPDLFMEKQTFLLSDKILCFSDASARLATSLGFAVEATKLGVVQQPYVSDVSIKAKKPTPKIKEVCYYGRRDLRHGYTTFLNSLLMIKDKLQRGKITVTLLGLPDRHAQKSYDELKQWVMTNGIPLKLLRGQNYFDEIEYLRKNQPLVVLPSIGENCGAAIVDCIENQVSFICSDIPIFKETVSEYGASRRLFFAAGSAESLAKKIISSIQKRPSSSVAKRTDRKVRLSQMVKEAGNSKPLSVVRNRGRKVSVCITHRDRALYLDELIRSLEPAMANIAEVLIYDDFSLLKESRKALKRLEESHDNITVVRGAKRSGPSYGRNVLAKQATADYILFIDDDNLLDADNFMKLLPLLDGKIDFLAAPLILFDNEMRSPSGPLLPDRILSRWSPLGTGLSMNLINNHIGDANMIMRRKFFNEIGGFSEDLTWGEDIELLVRASYKGGRYHFFTESFVYYRDHKYGLSKQVDARVGRRRMWKRFLENIGASAELHQFLNLFGSMAEALHDHESEKLPVIRVSSDADGATKHTHYYPPLVSLYRTDLYMTTPDRLVPNLDGFMNITANQAVKFQNIVRITLNSKRPSLAKRSRDWKHVTENQLVSFDVIVSDYCSIRINQDIEVRLEKGSNRISLSLSSAELLRITSINDIQHIYVCNVQFEVAGG